ncbi:MAG: hypothetical protein ACOX52_00435 [Verrucomicrobiota bacterium]
MGPTHPDRLVENDTAPSAGGSPNPDGKAWLGRRLPFRTGSSRRCNTTSKHARAWAEHRFLVPLAREAADCDRNDGKPEGGGGCPQG